MFIERMDTGTTVVLRSIVLINGNSIKKAISNLQKQDHNP